MSDTKPRGRPRTFDEDRVLGSILDKFWTKGYTACSMDELANAAHVSKPALYAAFGDKRAMYLRAMERFTGEFEGAVEMALGPDRPIAEGLLAFYRASLERFMSGDIGPRGCLVLCTAATESVVEPEIRAVLAGVLSKLDGALERSFAAAAASGQISRDADPRALASLAAATLHSLAIRVRAGEPRDQLEALITAAVRTFANPVDTPTPDEVRTLPPQVAGPITK